MQDEAEGTKKQCVRYATFKKWQRDLNYDHQMMSWFYYNTEKDGAKMVVAKLKCKVYTEFVDKIRGRKNISKKWIIVGADSVTVSNVYDHAKNEQHAHVMSLLKKQHFELNPMAWAPCHTLQLLKLFLSCLKMRKRSYQ